MRLVGGVGVAGEDRLERELLVDAVQPAGDQRGQRQVRVHVAARHAALDPQRRPVADHAERARAVVAAPGHRGRGERAGLVALVGVDVRGQEERQLAQGGELAGQEALEQRVVVGEHRRVVLRAQREVDVARVALALVVLGHEGDRHALQGRDLLGGVLVDRVEVAGADGVGVAEVDLVLAEVALALGVLHRQVRRRHLAPDAAEQRLEPRRPEDRVVDVVEVAGHHVAVGLVPRLLVGVAEDDELELGGGQRAPAALGEPVELGLEDLARRGDDRRAVVPVQVGHAHRRAGRPAHRPQRAEVGLHLEVAVAGLPRGHRVAVDRVHLDVDGEQVVAGLGAVLDHVLHEVRADQPLALQAALHVGEDEEDGVDRPLVDRLAQLVERHQWPASSASALSIAANSSSGAAPTRWWRE